MTSNVTIDSAEEEEIVDPNAHLKFVDKAKALNAPIKGYFVKHAKHELLIEKDRTGSNVLSSILEFYSGGLIFRANVTLDSNPFFIRTSIAREIRQGKRAKSV